jgi:DNA replication ATP-dependent helicase Dna2
LILHPDHLVSSTVIADSFSCTRRAVLQDRVKATGDAAPPMVYGTILHEIFQAALIANRWDIEYLGEVIEDIATKHVEDLYAIRIQVEDAREYLLSKMGELQSWAEIFVSAQVKVDKTVPFFFTLANAHLARGSRQGPSQQDSLDVCQQTA